MATTVGSSSTVSTTSMSSLTTTRNITENKVLQEIRNGNWRQAETLINQSNNPLDNTDCKNNLLEEAVATFLNSVRSQSGKVEVSEDLYYLISTLLQKTDPSDPSKYLLNFNKTAFSSGGCVATTKILVELCQRSTLTFQQKLCIFGQLFSNLNFNFASERETVSYDDWNADSDISSTQGKSSLEIFFDALVDGQLIDITNEDHVKTLLKTIQEKLISCKAKTDLVQAALSSLGKLGNFFIPMWLKSNLDYTCPEFIALISDVLASDKLSFVVDGIDRSMEILFKFERELVIVLKKQVIQLKAQSAPTEDLIQQTIGILSNLMMHKNFKPAFHEKNASGKNDVEEFLAPLLEFLTPRSADTLIRAFKNFSQNLQGGHNCSACSSIDMKKRPCVMSVYAKISPDVQTRITALLNSPASTTSTATTSSAPSSFSSSSPSTSPTISNIGSASENDKSSSATKPLSLDAIEPVTTSTPDSTLLPPPVTEPTPITAGSDVTLVDNTPVVHLGPLPNSDVQSLQVPDSDQQQPAAPVSTVVVMEESTQPDASLIPLQITTNDPQHQQQPPPPLPPLPIIVDNVDTFLRLQSGASADDEDDEVAPPLTFTSASTSSVTTDSSSTKFEPKHEHKEPKAVKILPPTLAAAAASVASTTTATMAPSHNMQYIAIFLMVVVALLIAILLYYAFKK